MQQKPGSTQRDFIFFSNRGSRQFAAALAPLGGRPYQQGDDASRIALLYFDDYNASDPRTRLEPPAIGEHCYTLIPRTRTRALDDKAEMASTLIAADVESPRVFFSTADVPDEPDSLWFVKQPFSSGGKGIVVATSDEVRRMSAARVIVQEAIQDLALIDGRKFTLRLYVLVHGGRLYLFDDGFMVVHARAYQRGSTDPLVQFAHEGYLDPESGLALRVFSELPDARRILDDAAQTLSDTFAAFANRLKFEPDNQYCLFGVDLLLKQNWKAVIVEINDRPNLVHSAEVNQRVNCPMLAAMAGVLNPVWRQEKASSNFSLLACL